MMVTSATTYITRTYMMKKEENSKRYSIKDLMIKSMYS